MIDRFREGLGMPRGVWSTATVAGVGVGVLYTLSPVTALSLLLTPSLFWWAGRGLKGRERAWVLSILGVALALRLLALLVFFAATDHVNRPFGVLQGDEEAIKKVSLWLHTLALGGSIAPDDVAELVHPYGQSSLPYAGALLNLGFGPSPYALHLLNVGCFMIAAVLLHRLARQAFGSLPALGGLAVMLGLPSLFMWSISALKESPYFLLSAVALYGFVRGVQARRFLDRAGWALTACGAIWVANTLREVAFVAVGGGLILGMLALWLSRSRLLAIVTVVALVAGSTVALRQPLVQEQFVRYVRIPARVHLGHVGTTGYTYRLLDPEVYARVAAQNDRALNLLQFDEATRFLIRAAISFVTVPLPWQAESSSAFIFLPQQVFWYVLVMLALIGVGHGLNREPTLTCLLAGVILCGGALVAVSNGNIGTLVRLRDMVVPFIAFLGALGGCAAVERVSDFLSRRSKRSQDWEYARG